eukprot:gene9055-12213_t
MKRRMREGILLFVLSILSINCYRLRKIKKEKKDKRITNTNKTVETTTSNSFKKNIVQSESLPSSEGYMEQPKKTIVITRIHKASSKSYPNIDKIISFVMNAVFYCDRVLICVGVNSTANTYTNNDSNDLFSEAHQYIKSIQNELKQINLAAFVDFVVICPWGYFTTALNSALQIALDGKYDEVMFQSLEFVIKRDAVVIMLDHIRSNPNIMVIGPEIPGHDFQLGKNILSGRTCPWNTCAIWNTNYLGLIGFISVADGTANDRSMGGVEEVSTISLLQLMKPNILAMLVRFTGTDISGINWDTTSFKDATREKYHDQKMKSKNDRPAKQMDLLGIPCGNVDHIVFESD